MMVPEGVDKEAARTALKDILFKMMTDFSVQEAQIINNLAAPMDYGRLSGQLFGVAKFVAFRLGVQTAEGLDEVVTTAYTAFLEHIDQEKHEPLVHFSRAYMAADAEEARSHLEKATEAQIKMMTGPMIVQEPQADPAEPPN